MTLQVDIAPLTGIQLKYPSTLLTVLQDEVSSSDESELHGLYATQTGIQARNVGPNIIADNSLRVVQYLNSTSENALLAYPITFSYPFCHCCRMHPIKKLLASVSNTYPPPSIGIANTGAFSNAFLSSLKALS